MLYFRSALNENVSIIGFSTTAIIRTSERFPMPQQPVVMRDEGHQTSLKKISKKFLKSAHKTHFRSSGDQKNL